MSVLSITAANVAASYDGPLVGVSGATLTAGMPVYVDTTDGNKIKIFGVSIDPSVFPFAGITVNNALSGQLVNYVFDDRLFYIGTSISAGYPIFVYGNSGQFCDDFADLGAAQYVTVVGVGLEYAEDFRLNLKPVTGGILG